MTLGTLPYAAAKKVSRESVAETNTEKDETVRVSRIFGAGCPWDAVALAKAGYLVITFDTPKITHCGVYRESRQKAVKLAIEWFDQDLKQPTSDAK